MFYGSSIGFVLYNFIHLSSKQKSWVHMHSMKLKFFHFKSLVSHYLYQLKREIVFHVPQSVFMRPGLWPGIFFTGYLFCELFKKVVKKVACSETLWIFFFLTKNIIFLKIRYKNRYKAKKAKFKTFLVFLFKDFILEKKHINML